MFTLLLACAKAPEDLSSYAHPQAGELAPEFSLVDENPASASYQQPVAVSEQRGSVSAWYFGHAT